MLKYTKIIDNVLKKCVVGTGTNTKFYQSIGMEQMDVEQAYDGSWYLMGYAPEKPQSLINQEKITELKQKLSETDYIIIKISEGSATKEEYADIIEQRQEWRKELNDLGI